MTSTPTRLATCRWRDGIWSAQVDEDGFLSLAEPGGWTPDRLARVSTGGPPAHRAEQIELEDVELLPPVLGPRRVWCVGHNYRGHIAEMGVPTPSEPTVFAKFASSLTGAHSRIPYTGEASAMDWEAELVVVMGRAVHRGSLEQSARAILGYTVGNDVTQRTWQRRTSQWTLGKVAEAGTPIGPWIVPAAALSRDQVVVETELRCRVNGKLVQSSTTADLVFGPAELVRFLSSMVPLAPGDLIFTGTPSGVGVATGATLSRGDVLTTEIDGIGVLSNMIGDACGVLQTSA